MGSWWGSADSSAPTPTASSFTPVEDNTGSAGSSDFISLMDDPSLSTTPRAPSSYDSRKSTQSFDDGDDDLGLGNSGSRSKRSMSTDAPEGEHTNGDAKDGAKPAAAPERPELKAAGSGSWFTRIWKREATTPGPVKANLGEQTSFYYDKELKRWVNKSGGTEAATSAAHPPPPRAQTASPGRSLPTGTPPPPPPARPATAIDRTQPPQKPPMRVRSNLVPSDLDGNASAPPTPASATLPPAPGAGPPPPGARKGTQVKRAVRSRYVDVFQQEAQGGSS